MFKTIMNPRKVFDLDIIKCNSKAIYSIRDPYCHPITQEFLEYKTYEGTIKGVDEDYIRFISVDTRISLCTEREVPIIDMWLFADDIDGYHAKLELL